MNPHKLPGAVGSFPCSQTFLPHIRGCHVLVRTDNATVVAYVNRQGGHTICNIAYTKSLIICDARRTFPVCVPVDPLQRTTSLRQVTFPLVSLITPVLIIMKEEQLPLILIVRCWPADCGWRNWCTSFTTSHGCCRCIERLALCAWPIKG